MLQVENISFSYRKGRKEVLSDFSLSLEAGRVYGLLGKNGAGKSTLLYLMSGLLAPKRGRVMYHDTDMRRRLKSKGISSIFLHLSWIKACSSSCCRMASSIKFLSPV